MRTQAERKDIYRVLEKTQRNRAKNLELLAEQHGGPLKLMSMLGLGPARYSHLAGPEPVARMGEALARWIEQQLHLSPRWMDENHDSRAGSGENGGGAQP